MKKEKKKKLDILSYVVLSSIRNLMKNGEEINYSRTRELIHRQYFPMISYLRFVKIAANLYILVFECNYKRSNYLDTAIKIYDCRN